MPKTPYAPLSKKERVASEKNKEAIQTQSKITLDRAAECLADPKFIDCKEQVEKLMNLAFEGLAQRMDPDPIKDAHCLRAYINTILSLRVIVKTPENIIKKGVLHAGAKR